MTRESSARAVTREYLAPLVEQPEPSANGDWYMVLDCEPALNEGQGESLGDFVKSELTRITTPTVAPPDMDPYPGTVQEVADAVVDWVLSMDQAGAAQGLVDLVRLRLAEERRCSAPCAACGSERGTVDVEGRG